MRPEGTQRPHTSARAVVASVGTGLTLSRLSAGKGSCPLVQRERGTWHLVPMGLGTLIPLWGPTLMTWSLIPLWGAHPHDLVTNPAVGGPPS